MPRQFWHTSTKGVHYDKWVWSSIDSVDPSHSTLHVWCYFLLELRSLSKIKFKTSYTLKIACVAGLSSFFLKQFYSKISGALVYDPAIIWLIFITVAILGAKSCWNIEHVSVVSNQLLSQRLLYGNVQVLSGALMQVQCL